MKFKPSLAVTTALLFGVAHRFLAAVSLVAVAAAAGMIGVPACAEELSNEDLAKLAQNPVGNLISVPFQNNTNFNVGPERGVQNILNIEPVVPFAISEQWNVITRTILPVIANPSLGPVAGAVNGLGDLQFNAFLSPAQPGTLLWGLGRSCRCLLIQAESWATTTSASGHPGWCFTLIRAIPGFTAP